MGRRDAKGDLERVGVNEHGQLFIGRGKAARHHIRLAQRAVKGGDQRGVIQRALRLALCDDGAGQPGLGLIDAGLGGGDGLSARQHGLTGGGGGQFGGFDRRRRAHASFGQTHLAFIGALLQVRLILRGGLFVQRQGQTAFGIAHLGFGIQKVCLGTVKGGLRIGGVDAHQHLTRLDDATILEPVRQFDDAPRRGRAQLKAAAALDFAKGFQHRRFGARLGTHHAHCEHTFAGGRCAGLARKPFLHRTAHQLPSIGQQPQADRRQHQSDQALSQKSHVSTLSATVRKFKIARHNAFPSTIKQQCCYDAARHFRR